MIKFNQKLDENKKYFITSDLHFWHRNIMKFCTKTRPYNSLEEMHESVIVNWNSKVGDNDIVFHLGDFSFNGHEKTKQVLDQLKGEIVFILGNHDKTIRTHFKEKDYQTFDYLELKYKGHKVVMCHYPLGSWNGQGRGSIHFHGHSHGSYPPVGRMLDVGWDSVGEVITLDTAIHVASQRCIEVTDHHKIITEGEDKGEI